MPRRPKPNKRTAAASAGVQGEEDEERVCELSRPGSDKRARQTDASKEVGHEAQTMGSTDRSDLGAAGASKAAASRANSGKNVFNGSIQRNGLVQRMTSPTPDSIHAKSSMSDVTCSGMPIQHADLMWFTCHRARKTAEEMVQDVERFAREDLFARCKFISNAQMMAFSAAPGSLSHFVCNKLMVPSTEWSIFWEHFKERIRRQITIKRTSVIQRIKREFMSE